MSKCREEFEKHFAGMNLLREILGTELAPFYYCFDTQERWEDWQAAWNARGKVDAEICREDESGRDSGGYFAEAIEQEDEHG